MNFELEQLETSLYQNEEAEVETAAGKPRKNQEFSNPVQQIKRGLLSIILNSYTTFRSVVSASLQNDKATDVFEGQGVGAAIGYDLSNLMVLQTPQQLREYFALKAGNGSNDPIIISFSEVFSNIPKASIDKLFSYLPKNAAGSKGMTLLDFAQEVDGFSITPEIGRTVAGNIADFTKYYVEPLNGTVDFRVRLLREVFNEDTGNESIVYRFDIMIDGAIYNEVIDADSFSPYLVYLWVKNSLTNLKSRANTIVDPRKVSGMYQRTIKKHGTPRAKLNSNNFGLDGSGVPIFVPPQVDNVDAFVKKADSCLDEDGYFTARDLIETHKLNNQIIYVDWINDIMAYTSNQGVLETYDLSNVHPLDPSSEYELLSSKITLPLFKRSNEIITRWMRDLTPEQAIKYAETPEAKQIFLNNTTPATVFQTLYTKSGMPPIPDITFKHIMGYRSEEFTNLGNEEEAQNKLVADFYNGYICAARACFKALQAARIANQNNPDAFKLPEGIISQGLIAKLIGVEFLIHALGKSDVKYVAGLEDAYKIERFKAKKDTANRSIAIPNVALSKGFTGLLPHQGEIITSLMKTPKTAILPVGTGGGKTVITAAQAIFGIKNDPKCRPMIITKGNLVKGTINEINVISQGKLNAIPFRPAILRWIKKSSGYDSFTDFKTKWFDKLPPNTVFVSSYSDYKSRRRIFDDLEVAGGFLQYESYTNQFLMIIKLLGFRMFIGDETHLIKNPESKRSRNSYSAFSQGDYRSAASGTIVSNTVADLVGQTRAISPLIFGDSAERFCAAYNIEDGLIRTDESADIIKGRLKATTAYHEATAEDWSYMLPTADDTIVRAALTDRQTEFYNILMREAELLMEEAEKNKKKGKKPKTEEGEEGDDEEEEEDDEDEDEGGEEDASDAAVIAAAQTYLSKVEQFLVAPDMNEQYLAFRGDPATGQVYSDTPKGEDLVSPKVRKCDELIDAHIAKHRNDMRQNKILIFGVNKVASAHFMRHSKYAGRTLHYVASGTSMSGDAGPEAMRKFENNADNWILVADETSVREGFNLQMSSLTLRLQSVWSPGDHIQTKARMYRPDPRGKYNRETVQHIWILAGLPNNRPSLDVVKMGRLVSKFVSNARLTYSGRIEWRRVSKEFDDLEMLRMNLRLIFNATNEDIDPYIDSWATYVHWENDINRQARRQMAERLERDTGEDLVDEAGRIRDINKFVQLAMYKVTVAPDIPGTKRVWVPYTSGTIPPDPQGWGFSTMGQQEVAPNSAVYTEFGPAILLKTGTGKTCQVQIYNGKKVNLPRAVVLLVRPDRYAEFAAIVKDPQKWRKEAIDINGSDPTGSATRPIVPVAEEEEIEELTGDDLDENEDTEAGDKEDLEPIPAIINGWPALVVMDDVPALAPLDGWKRIDPFISLTFRTWDMAERFLEILEEKTYVASVVYNALQEEMRSLRSGKAMTLNQQINSASVRDFFQSQHKTLGKSKSGKYVVRPYWIAVEHEVRIAFDIDSHNQSVINWLKKYDSKPGVTVKRNGAIWINTFRTVREALDDIENLKSVAVFDETDVKKALAEIKTEIAQLRQPRVKPKL